MNWRAVAAVAAVLGFLTFQNDADAAKPPATADLRQAAKVAAEIDASLAKEVLTPGVDVAPRCDDATYLRRVWLDIVGDIPTLRLRQSLP